MKRIVLVVIGIIIGALVYGLVDYLNQPAKQAYTIIDKYEIKDSCFLAMQVEVAPEEFIGYDIGDEYYAD